MNEERYVHRLDLVRKGKWDPGKDEFSPESRSGNLSGGERGMAGEGVVDVEKQKSFEKKLSQSGFH